MATIKLNQAIAIEKGVKARAYSETTELHKQLQKEDLLTGFIKSYQKKNDEAMDLPAETKKIQLNAEDALKRVAKINAEAWDVEATKDYGNCSAHADVVVNGHMLIPNAPPTFLLYLEKQLNDLHTLVKSIIPLSDAAEWKAHTQSGQWASEPRQTHRTEKVQKAITKYDATPEHPAQTEMITQDIIVGFWTTIHYSGAMPTSRKRALLERIETLASAVKAAREEANTTTVDKIQLAGVLFEHLLQP